MNWENTQLSIQIRTTEKAVVQRQTHNCFANFGKLPGKQPLRYIILVKLQAFIQKMLLKQDLTASNFLKTFQNFRALFLYNTSGWLLLNLQKILIVSTPYCLSHMHVGIRRSENEWSIRNYMLKNLAANNLKTLLQSNIILTSDISKSNTRLVRVVPCSQNAHTTHRLALFAIYYNKSNTENKIRIQKQNIKELAQ